MVPFSPKGMWLDYSKAETINPFTDRIQKFTVIEAQKESSSYKKYPVSITYMRQNWSARYECVILLEK